MLFREWRKSCALSLAEVAERFGVSIGWLSEVETGRVFPSPERVAFIAAATRDEVTLHDHWVTWGQANMDKFKESRAAGRRAAKTYRKPAKPKGGPRGRKLEGK